MVRGKASAAQAKPRQGAKADEAKQAPKAPKVSAAAMGQQRRLGDKLQQYIVDLVKGQRETWAKSSERDRQRVIDRAKELAFDAVHELSYAIANDGHDRYLVSVGKFEGVVGDGTVVTKVALPYSKDLVDRLMTGAKMTLTAHDLTKHFGGAPIKPGVIGDLGLPDPDNPEEPPKTGPGAPSDPEAEAQLGRGSAKGQEMPGDIGPTVPAPPVDGEGAPLKHDAEGEVTEDNRDLRGDEQQRREQEKLNESAPPPSAA